MTGDQTTSKGDPDFAETERLLAGLHFTPRHRSVLRSLAARVAASHHEVARVPRSMSPRAMLGLAASLMLVVMPVSGPGKPSARWSGSIPAARTSMAAARPTMASCSRRAGGRSAAFGCTRTGMAAGRCRRPTSFALRAARCPRARGRARCAHHAHLLR